MRPGRPGRRGWALAALALVVAGCGDSGPSDEEQVRATLTAFTRATAAKDYQALCDRVFAPDLVKKLSEKIDGRDI